MLRKCNVIDVAILGSIKHFKNKKLYLVTGMKRRKKFQPFTEGWVEFHDKKVAKYVATWLNNTQIGGKRKIPHYDYLWNIKYLHRYGFNLFKKNSNHLFHRRG